MFRTSTRRMDKLYRAAFHRPRRSLWVDYLKPTPLGMELQIRGRVTEESARKKVVTVTIFAAGTTTVRAEVIAVRMPKEMKSQPVGTE